ncbi:hypothetical protein RJ639_027080 [Escallonia herrerae]|uniref:UDP-glycosyltransferase 89A2-like n=1 Tax=Escallonia herrerae TaxID=1293975 RepID=A0AA89BKC5_9ASTE|nr:hypothetical protein RJ639_027080 [Escallonia herrerae]
MSGSGKGIHILVFPYPAQGHMLALLDLSHQLALHGLTITILVTPKNLPILSPLLATHPSIQTLVFSFPSYPSLPPGVENVKDIGNHGNVSIINALGELHDPIIQWFKSHPNPPVALLSDFFLGWTQHLANQINIPRIAFFSSGAFLTSVLGHLWDDIQSFRSLTMANFPDLPRSPSFTAEQLPSVFRHYKESEPSWNFVKDGMIANNFSWGCVINTFDDLEGEHMEYLKKKVGHGRVFGVGPLSLLGRPDQTDRGSKGSGLCDDVLEWLDGCPDGSVVYVCFGSQKFFKQAQVEALAIGLERSGANTVPDVSELARTIADSMSGGKIEKVKAKELKEKALEAVKAGGSSYRDLDGLVKELSQLQI